MSMCLIVYVCLALSLANIFSEPQTSCISVSYYSGTFLNKLFQIKCTMQIFYPKGQVDVFLIQVLAIEFVAFAVEFVLLANEFVTLAIEFIPWAIEFVALAWKFVMNE